MSRKTSAFALPALSIREKVDFSQSMKLLSQDFNLIQSIEAGHMKINVYKLQETEQYV